jgi:glycosyltransferase involved in cell wall biosynthesis
MSEKLRVLMVSKACIVGIYQRKLEEIAKQDIDLTVIVPPSWQDERGEMKLERVYTEGYQMEVLPIRFNGNFHLHYYVGLGAKVAAFKPHIFHIDEEPYNLSAWQMLYYAEKVGAKSLFFSWQNLYRQYPPPFRWGEQWVLNNVDYALMGTESAGEVWRQKGYTNGYKVVPQFGTDTALFNPAPSIPERPFTIGYFGRLVEEKGVEMLLDAVARLEGNWRLRMLGGGPLLPKLQAQAETHGIAERVEFVGQIPSTDMPSQYHSLDALVLPSLTRPNWKEQFGRVLVEGMASGVPVIGSNSGAIPDVIGDAGLIFPESSVSKLTAALQTLQENPEKRDVLRIKGRARATQHFTHHQIAEQTVKVYRGLVRHGKNHDFRE